MHTPIAIKCISLKLIYQLHATHRAVSPNTNHIGAPAPNILDLIHVK